MSQTGQRSPLIERLYHQYLHDQDAAHFIRRVAEHYLSSTLERIVAHGDCSGRRAAALALSFLGDFAATPVLGRALRDPDRSVRLICETGIRELWCRCGTDEQRQTVRTVIHLNRCGRSAAAVPLADRLLAEAPWFAEARHQRGVALFYLRRHGEASRDFHETLELNPYHFDAAVALGTCHLQLNQLPAALDCFRRALRLHPGLEQVRLQIQYLQRVLDGPA